MVRPLLLLAALALVFAAPSSGWAQVRKTTGGVCVRDNVAGGEKNLEQHHYNKAPKTAYESLDDCYRSGGKPWGSKDKRPAPSSGAALYREEDSPGVHPVVSSLATPPSEFLERDLKRLDKCPLLCLRSPPD